jgi:hypothetical protein
MMFQYSSIPLFQCLSISLFQRSNFPFESFPIAVFEFRISEFV